LAAEEVEEGAGDLESMTSGGVDPSTLIME
jgi:hypothetical protein